LIVFADDRSADLLFKASQKYGADLRQLIEPALAKWRFAPIVNIWQKRLEAKGTRFRDLVLAIHGVAEVGDKSAVPALLAMLHDPLRAGALRLEAARSAGRLQTSGLEPEAERLTRLSSVPILQRLCAAALLAQHDSESAITTLLRLAIDVEPSVAAAALSRLNAINHDLVVPIAEQVMRNDDANVRQQGVDAYVARPTPERVSFVCRLLDDPHPSLRAGVRESLFRLAQQAELDAVIRLTASGVMANDSWRGQEQAALLLSALDHKPAVTRLVELLESPRDEVMVATAWGLRVLAVPDTLPAILDKASRQTEARVKNQSNSNALDDQVAHLCEALGLMKYAPAEPLLRRYVPKIPALGELSRGAAIWALGHLHAGVSDEPLAVLMVERLTEPIGPFPPEVQRVRHASAISLGRMQSKSQTERMRAFLGPKVGIDPTSLAIRWAIHELTGELLPEPDRPTFSRSGWFLEPLDYKVRVSPSP
jgi:HEAT repeat protein